MPKKKPPANPFYFFMLDYKARCEKNGEHFPNGLKDVQTEAGPEWDAMPKEQKRKYEMMAKEEKARLKNDTSQKLTCWHTPFSSIDRQKREEEELKAQINGFIESTLMSLSSKKSLAEYKFYLIHVNHFCISEGECYHPAELAIAEFCLGDGVTDVYHTIIDPGPIPLGYRYDAIQKSDSTHKIPVDDNGGEKLFSKIIQDIKKFIQPGTNALGGEYPPLFTMPDNVSINTSTKAVQSVIENLCNADAIECNNVDKYRIYPIQKLFLELRNVCCRRAQDEGNVLPNIGVALSELEKDVFNFNQEIACGFHQNIDAVEYCSKSYVQRWVFLICDHCCQYLDIDIVPGRHLPLKVDYDYSNRMQLKELEEKPTKIQPRPFTWNENKVEREPWTPVEQPPLRRPTRQPNLAAMLPVQPERPEPESLDMSNFPSLDNGSFVMGRGKGQFRGGKGGRGGGSSGGSEKMSFASAMKK